MKVLETEFSGLLVIEPEVFRDERGFFLETHSFARYQESGLCETFVQDNHSFSSKGTLRGLHYQKRRPQGKLVRVTHGSVFDVAVDLRTLSPTFAKFFSIELNGEKLNQLYIPPGFAHGFCVLSDYAHFEYKCTDYYFPDDEGGIIWNDLDINIPWPVGAPSLSEKDCGFRALSSLDKSDLPEVSS